jgi:hypothetical protein
MMLLWRRLYKVRVSPAVLSFKPVTSSTISNCLASSFIALSRDAASGSLWARLNNAAESSNQRLRDAAREQWRQFIESLGHIDSSAVLESRMLKTPSNEAILAKYKEHYGKFQSALRVELPTTASAREDLTVAVAALRELRDQLKGNAPDAVRVFLKAIENGGAALELLTPDVLQWIRDNDDPNRFVIKPRNSQSWR